MKIYDYIRIAFRLDATEDEANAKHEEHLQIIQGWDDKWADEVADAIEMAFITVTEEGRDSITYCFELGMMAGALLEQRKQREAIQLEMLMQRRVGERG